MKPVMAAAVAFFLMVNVYGALAAAPVQKDPPPGGTVLVPADAIVSPALKTTGQEYAKVETVAVDGEPFKKAIHVSVTKRPLKYYNVQAKLAKLPAIKEGDVLLSSFYARCTGGGNNDTGTGQVNFGIQQKETNKLIGNPFIAQPNGEWQRFYVPVKVTTDLAAGSYAISFSFGAMTQEIEVGGFEVVNYGTKVTEADLPQTIVTYPGREDDAPWRAEAAKRIEQYRKGDLTVTVTNAAGQPVPGAEVEVKMTRHAFQFGAAVTARCFENSENGENILKYDAELFNQGLPISWMYWRDVNDPAARANADKIYAFFKKNNMVTRGHVLMYERDDLIPDDVKEMIAKKESDKLRKTVTDYITDQVTRFKGRVNEWVVENEAVDNSEIRDAIGKDSIADFFKIAHAADPTAKLMINENRVEGLKPDKSDRLLALVKQIVDNGGPLDTIGIQGHMESTPVGPETLLKQYDKLAATGKRLAITEYDFNTQDEQLKADYTRDFYTTVFSDPSFNGITIWRYWDGKPEKRESVIFRNDWTMRPSGKVYQDLVFKQWWTHVTGQTAANGQYATRGFCGSYEITVKSGGKTTTSTVDVANDKPASVTIKIP